MNKYVRYNYRHLEARFMNSCVLIFYSMQLREIDCETNKEISRKALALLKSKGRNVTSFLIYAFLSPRNFFILLSG